jgi:hypothetical protein
MLTPPAISGTGKFHLPQGGKQELGPSGLPVCPQKQSALFNPEMRIRPLDMREEKKHEESHPAGDTLSG